MYYDTGSSFFPKLADFWKVWKDMERNQLETQQGNEVFGNMLADVIAFHYAQGNMVDTGAVVDFYHKICKAYQSVSADHHWHAAIMKQARGRMKERGVMDKVLMQYLMTPEYGWKARKK